MTDAGSRGSIQWARIFAEGAAIVVSILVAFSVDAWWDARQDLALEREHLVALQAQFLGVVQIIDAEAAQLEQATAAGRWLVSLTPEEATAVPTDSLAASFVRLFSVGRANLPSGALDALMASGSLGMIGDPELVVRLASWPSAVAEVYENSSWLVEHREREFAPFLRRYVGGLWTAGRSGFLDDYPQTRFPPRVAEMFADREIEGHLSYASLRTRVILDRYSVLRAEADSIVRLIELRLASRRF